MSDENLREFRVTNEEIESLKETIRNLYLADDIPWVIGYSGGKDSTATLQLVWITLQELDAWKLHKPVHIINTDTLVESPVISKWVENSLEMMQRAANEQNLPFITHRLTPETNNTFWVNIIGRGYPFPRKKIRWCTDRLKIQPVNNFIKNKIAEHGEIILVIGTRKAESSNRARTMAKYEKLRVRELLSPNPTLANELVFSPLENWKDNDVWVFLMQYKNPWGLSNHELQTLYMSATEDSGGKSRFGCWVCTMVEKDKSMEAMIANDEEKAWMTPLLEFRNYFGDEENDRSRRSFRKMQGYITGTYDRLHHGPYLKEIREEWLKKLLEIQLDINQNGPNEFSNLELISIPELRCIRRIWVNEKHEFDDSLPIIYKSVTGQEFDDPDWISNESFGEDEWNILKQVCEDLYPDEELSFEMMYSMIDTEASINSVNERKGILNSLESCVKKTFYTNEEDATTYYRDQLERKKNMGGKYNEKFFVTIKDESEEFDDMQAEVVEE